MKIPQTLVEIQFHPLRKAYRDLIPLSVRKTIEPTIATIRAAGLPYFKRFMAKTLELRGFTFNAVWEHLQRIDFTHNK